MSKRNQILGSGILFSLCFVLSPYLLASGNDGGGHHDPFAFILLELTIVIFVAMIGRWAARHLNQPTVLGELLVGVIILNLRQWWPHSATVT